MRLNSEACREIQDLAWRLLDHRLGEQARARLDALLLESDEARSLYAHCLWLHSELAWSFAPHVGDPAPIAAAHARFLSQLPLGTDSPDPMV